MSRTSNSLRDTILPLALLAGDTMVTFGGLALGWWLRYESPLARWGVDVPDASFGRYLPLLLVGVALLTAAFAQFGLYDARLLLRRYQSLNAIIKGTAFWLLAYLGVSLVLKFDPPISRLFALIGFGCVIALLHVWRSFAYAVITSTPLLKRLRRRTVLLGWNADAQALSDEMTKDAMHPLTLSGVVTLHADAVDANIPLLGGVDDLEKILRRESADIVIATRLDIPREDIRRIVEICERNYIEWKIVPGAFDIFLSGLRLQTIGRVPVLGVEELAINRLFYRALKRFCDLIGGAVGLLLSLPAIVVIAALIKRESPKGPIFFRQQRVGAGHRRFVMYKLRSMTPKAETADTQNQSTIRNDPRLLRIGAFIRRWNLDELPQFWNVLRGEMSLVGPRPERPYHVDQLASNIAHYLPRHVVKPGMTGWAQIHGLRGETDLGARIQHDIYYIENWSIWLDIQIILLTFVRWRQCDRDVPFSPS